MKIAGGPRPEPYWLYLAAGALLAGGPVWHYLYVNHYPFSRPEAPLLTLGAALAGAAAAAAAHRIGGVIEGAVFAALLFLWVDLQFDLHDRIRAPVMLAILLGLSLLLQARRSLLTCLTLGAFYLAALPRAGIGTGSAARPAAGNGRTGPPVLVHVILDEQWGIGGLRAEGDSGTAAFLTEFYHGQGFELYPAAYSRSHRTVKSIPEMVSLGQVPNLRIKDGSTYSSGTFGGIPYFELLRARGYEIRVFQTSYLDFCVAPGAPVASCESQSANSIANIGYVEGSWTARGRLALRYLLNVTSHLYRRLHPDPEIWRRASAGGALLALRHARDAIAAGPKSGTAYFIHVLLPHRPLEVDEQCRALADPTRRVGFEQPARLDDSTWTATLKLEDDQIRCTHQALAEVLAALDSAVGREHSIVVVHGDHGVRISRNRPHFAALATLDDRQLNERFSTLLAVRRPGVPPAVLTEPVPVQDFLWRLAGQEFLGPVAAGYSHFVRNSWADSLSVDTVRALTPAHMLWARP